MGSYRFYAVAAKEPVLTAEELDLHRTFVVDLEVPAIHGKGETSTCNTNARRGKSAGR